MPKTKLVAFGTYTQPTDLKSRGVIPNTKPATGKHVGALYGTTPAKNPRYARFDRFWKDRNDKTFPVRVYRPDAAHEKQPWE